MTIFRVFKIDEDYLNISVWSMYDDSDAISIDMDVAIKYWLAKPLEPIRPGGKLVWFAVNINMAISYATECLFC